jgi:hypothetical protein
LCALLSAIPRRIGAGDAATAMMKVSIAMG